MHAAQRILVPALVLATIITALPSTVRADGPPLAIELGDFTVIPHLQYRPRFVVHTGKDFMDGPTYTAFHQRARLGVEVKAWDWVTAKIELQDVRVWGEETNTLTDFNADGFDMHQGYVELKTPIGLSFRVGRQEINFDNQRLIGAVGWSDQARSFDAINIIFDRDSMDANLFFALAGEKNAFKAAPDGTAIKGSKEDVYVVGFRYRYSGLAAFRPTMVTIFDRQGPTDQNRVTMGLYIDGQPLTGLTYSAEFYYQAGKQQTKTTNPDIDIRAFMAAARVGYVVPVFMKPGITAFFDFLSGDDPSDKKDATTRRTFDTLYATNHKFYGFMDFFLNVPVHTDGFGIMDVGGRVQASPLDGMLVFLDFHHFEQAVEDPQQKTRTLGNEVDVVVKYKFNKYLSTEAVYGVFIPKLGGSLRKGTKTGAAGDFKYTAYGTSTEHFGYLQLNLEL